MVESDFGDSYFEESGSGNSGLGEYFGFGDFVLGNSGLGEYFGFGDFVFFEKKL